MGLGSSVRKALSKAKGVAGLAASAYTGGAGAVAANYLTAFATQLASGGQPDALTMATNPDELTANQYLGGGVGSVAGSKSVPGVVPPGGTPMTQPGIAQSTVAGSVAGATMSTMGGAPEAGIPPDVNYANDPEAQMQFKRLRRAAALLGRAGTIRAKGAANLGSTQPLGTDMALA